MTNEMRLVCEAASGKCEVRPRDGSENSKQRSLSKERVGQFEEFECNEGGPGSARDESDRNGRDNEDVTHDLHPRY
jgi:hypothetical protein